MKGLGLYGNLPNKFIKGNFFVAAIACCGYGFNGVLVVSPKGDFPSEFLRPFIFENVLKLDIAPKEKPISIFAGFNVREI